MAPTHLRVVGFSCYSLFALVAFLFLLFLLAFLFLLFFVCFGCFFLLFLLAFLFLLFLLAFLFLLFLLAFLFLLFLLAFLFLLFLLAFFFLLFLLAISFLVILACFFFLVILACFSEDLEAPCATHSADAMQLEPHGSASAGTSSFAIQAHCFVRAIEHLRKVQLHVLPERVQRLGGLDGRTLSLSRIWICIKHAQKNCNHLILNSSIIAEEFAGSHVRPTAPMQCSWSRMEVPLLALLLLRSRPIAL